MITPNPVTNCRDIQARASQGRSETLWGHRRSRFESQSVRHNRASGRTPGGSTKSIFADGLSGKHPERPSKVRLAQAAMVNCDTSVSELCTEFGIKPITLYWHG